METTKKQMLNSLNENNIEAFKKLLAKDNEMLMKRNSIFALAAIHDNPAFLEYIRTQYSLKDIHYENKKEVIIKAIQHCNLEKIKYLSEHGFHFDEKNSKAVLIACRHQKIEALLYMIENGANLNNVDNSNFPLKEACKQNNKEIFELLLEYGADIATENYGTMKYCIDYDKLDFLELILTHCKIDWSFQGDYSISHALDKKSTEMLELFCQHGADLNNDSYALLRSSYQKPEYLYILLDHGLCIDNINPKKINEEMNSVINCWKLNKELNQYLEEKNEQPKMKV